MSLDTLKDVFLSTTSDMYKIRRNGEDHRDYILSLKDNLQIFTDDEILPPEEYDGNGSDVRMDLKNLVLTIVGGSDCVNEH